MIYEILPYLAVAWIYICLIGALLGSNRGNAGLGFLFALAMGPIGWIVIMLHPEAKDNARPIRVPVLAKCAKCKTILNFTDLPAGDYKCWYCDRTFTFLNNKVTGKEPIESEREAIKGCPHCEAKYDFSNMAPGVYTCGECNKTFKLEISAVTAAKELRKTVEQECPRCKSKFALPKFASGNCRCPECTHVFKPAGAD
jgi:ribosomal protein L37AE/L43A